jgi:glycosyltransferase involved in cell wall biosynthesis
MKVLFLDHARTVISGAEFRLLDLVSALPAHAVTPLVACDPASPLAARLRDLGVEQVPIIFPEIQANPTVSRLATNIAALIQTTLELCRQIRKNAVDVVHVNTLLPRLPGLFAAHLCRRPVVWHIRDFVIQPAWRRLYSALAPMVSSIVRVSDACRSEFPLHPRILTIYNGLDPKRYQLDRNAARREFGLDGATVAIGFVGLLAPWKGPELLLEAAGRLPLRALPQTLFLIVGGESPKAAGQRPRLERKAYQLGIADRTRFLGFTAEVPRLLAALDIVVAPSLRQDPFPGSVLEAMAAALPVVASRVGGIPEMVEDGRTGVLVEPGNADALAHGLAHLANSPELRRLMGVAGREVVESRFQLETSVRRLVELYAEL